MTAAPPLYDADGQLMQEADGTAALPWNVRNELEGSRVTRHEDPGTIAELPGSERFAGEQGAPNTLSHEATRQLGTSWQGPSLRVLNTGTGREHLQPAG